MSEPLDHILEALRLLVCHHQHRIVCFNDHVTVQTQRHDQSVVSQHVAVPTTLSNHIAAKHVTVTVPSSRKRTMVPM